MLLRVLPAQPDSAMADRLFYQRLVHTGQARQTGEVENNGHQAGPVNRT